MIRWAGLNPSRLLTVINTELESAERKQRTLDALLASGKISSATYDRMNGRFLKLVENIRDLKEVLKQEQNLWRTWLDEQIKVLETVLAGFELRHLSGEFNAEKWEHARLILTSGLDSIRAMGKSDIRPLSRPSPPSTPKPILEKEETRMKNNTKSIHIEANAAKIGAVDSLKGTRKNKSKTRNLSRSRTGVRHRRRPRKSRSDPFSEMRCRNPWNGDCRNTDIELSIYYEGEFLPLCHDCWREISEKNLEWSGF